MSRNMLARAKAALFDVAPTGSYVPSFLPRREPIPDGGARILKLPRHMLAGDPVDLTELETAINATETETMTTTDTDTAQTGLSTSAVHADVMRQQLAALNDERTKVEANLSAATSKFEEFKADCETRLADLAKTMQGYDAALAVLDPEPAPAPAAKSRAIAAT
jgi:hypothetical protein